MNKFHPNRQSHPYDSMNAGQRAERGEAAMIAWRACTFNGFNPDVEDESNIRDAICDILHYAHKVCSRKGYDGYSPMESVESAINAWKEESDNDHEA